MQRLPRLIIAGCFGVAAVLASSCEEEPEDGQRSALGDASVCANCAADAGGVAPINPGPADIARCAQLAPSACVTDPACAVMYGLSYDKAQHCRAAGMVAVGCRALGEGCGGSYTLATDPSGGAWRLGDVCLPPGWQHPPVEPQPARWVEDFPVCASSQVEANCARLTSLASCQFDVTCYGVKGMRINELRRCKEGDWQFVACTQNKGCNGLSLLAKDTTGSLWELPGSCLPLGWTTLANTEANSVRHDWPACKL
jgi:hypothetical protein